MHPPGVRAGLPCTSLITQSAQRGPWRGDTQTWGPPMLPPRLGCAQSLASRGETRFLWQQSPACPGDGAAQLCSSRPFRELELLMLNSGSFALWLWAVAAWVVQRVADGPRGGQRGRLQAAGLCAVGGVALRRAVEVAGRCLWAARQRRCGRARTTVRAQMPSHHPLLCAVGSAVCAAPGSARLC